MFIINIIIFVMNYLKHFMGMVKGAKQFKQMKDIPEVTEFLKNNKNFQDASWKIHNMKSKFIEKLDEEAFGKDHKAKTKKIDGKKK